METTRKHKRRHITFNGVNRLRFLITGGSGLLGSKIAYILVKRGCKTFSGHNTHRAKYGIPIKFDITNRDEVKKAFEISKPEVVIHAAALTDVDECEKDKEYAWEVNVKGTENIVKFSQLSNAFLIYVSSDYVFSGEKGLYTETDAPNPINYYGLTKLEGEKIVSESSLPWCIVRPSVIFGSVPSVGKVNFALWVIRKLRTGRELRIFKNQYASPTLNTNLAEMILEIIERRLTGVYHLAGATPINRYEFARLIAETFELDKSLISVDKCGKKRWFAKRPENTSLDVGKALRILKNKPLEIHEALRKLKEEIKHKERIL